ncbi:MAG: DUF6856 family protein [Mycoplasmoidaceae bacterium]
MKKILKLGLIISSIGIGSIIVIATPLAISARSVNWNALQTFSINNLNPSGFLSGYNHGNFNIRDALYGTKNINKGNYIILYASLSQIDDDQIFNFDSTLSNWKFFQSRNIADKPVITNDISKIQFQNEFVKRYNEYKVISNVANLNIILDINPYINSSAASLDSKYEIKSFANPDSKWTKEMILDWYNYFDSGNSRLPGEVNRPHSYKDHWKINDFKKLPSYYRSLENTFIRNDKSAINYREMTNFVSRWRSQINSLTGGSNNLSGVIGYTQTKTYDPNNKAKSGLTKPFFTQQIDVSNLDSLFSSLRTFYLNEK